MDLNLDENDKTFIIPTSSDDTTKNQCSPCTNLPTAIYFITITELCERFTFYGFRSVLILYLTQHLLLQESNAVSVYHFFICLCYLTTILGSFISDNYLGKYKTLVIIGSIYTLGSSLMSLTAIPAPNLAGPLISLILIGFGTGGVKACVGPFGGDQIPSDKKLTLGSYFSMFYFAINIGALLSTIVTPMFRANVACNGSDDCYPLAFGVPAILMGAAMVIFLAGRRHYVQVPVNESIYARSAKCLWVAIRTWYRERRTNPRKQLLDYASDEYDSEFIKDLRTLCNIAILYLPLPVYWALYEQMGSRWTLQAVLMDGEIFPGFVILPDQIFIFNVLFVVVLIVVFDVCIYPIAYKISPTLRPLKRMTLGITFTFLAFLTAFALQKYMEDREPIDIKPLHSRLFLVNGRPCDASIVTQDGRLLQAGSYQTSTSFLDVPAGAERLQVTIAKCDAIMTATSMNGTFTLYPGEKNFLIVDHDSEGHVVTRVIHDNRSSNIKGYPFIRLTMDSRLFEGYQFQLVNSFTVKTEKQFTISGNQSLFLGDWEKLSKPAKYQWMVKAPTVFGNSSQVAWSSVLASNGGYLLYDPVKIVSAEVSIFYMTYSSQRRIVIVVPLIIHKGSQISVLWQLPQYFLISIGEVLVNIPGLTFSYDQAPVGMKSLVNALWYLCDALGNFIVMIVAETQLFQKQSWEFLAFAVVCIVFNVVFAVLAYYYPMVHRGDYTEMT